MLISIFCMKCLFWTQKFTEPADICKCCLVCCCLSRFVCWICGWLWLWLCLQIFQLQVYIFISWEVPPYDFYTHICFSVITHNDDICVSLCRRNFTWQRTTTSSPWSQKRVLLLDDEIEIETVCSNINTK